MSMLQRRNRLLQLFQSALDAVSGERAVARYLADNPINKPCSVLAIGKAAAAMTMGAQQVLGDQVRRGLVITKQGHSDPRLASAPVEQIESAHPIPDQRSLDAGDTLLKFLAAPSAEETLLFLLSGGASSLVEVLPDGMSTQQLAELNSWLLASGLPISDMNAIRKRVSQIKGGKLLPHIKGRTVLQLLVSDVPGDDHGVIGSGPLIPSQESGDNLKKLPDWLQSLLMQDTPEAIDEAVQIESCLVATNKLACAAVKGAAEAYGEDVYHYQGHYQGDVHVLAEEFTATLKQAPMGIHLWGGEGSVVLPSEPGRGGRNQHLALLMAQKLAGENNVLVLAAGTDGSDGPTEDAGAIVDGETIRRGELEMNSVTDAINYADSGSFLEASGDLITTGPTGTNVMDLVIAWKW